jgi:hypothetical protein
MARMESDDTLSAVQSLLALDLNKMSLNEREKVFEDLHGVSDVVDESPELVASCLDELELENSKDTTQRRVHCGSKQGFKLHKQQNSAAQVLESREL